MKYFSMFSGIGGFEYGIDCGSILQEKTSENIQDLSGITQGQTRFTCIGYSEIDKYATAIYDYHYGGHKNYGNATAIIPSELPDFDLLVGGFPCQAFSIAGKRLGFDDTRGTLFFEIARILKVKRPKHFILENVKGLLSHDNGRTFKTIISTLVGLGYSVEWQVLNSKNHGVPQNRERVFIVGYLGGEGCGKVFPIGEDDTIHNKQNEPDQRRTQASNSVPVRGSNMKADHTFIHNKYGGFNEDKVRQFEDVCPTIRTPSGGGHLPDLITKGKIRRLTPIECERLQGFPDNWTKYGKFPDGIKEISDSQRYKCLGNAVTTNVVAEVVRRLYEKTI